MTATDSTESCMPSQLCVKTSSNFTTMFELQGNYSLQFNGTTASYVQTTDWFLGASGWTFKLNGMLVFCVHMCVCVCFVGWVVICPPFFSVFFFAFCSLFSLIPVGFY